MARFWVGIGLLFLLALFVLVAATAILSRAGIGGPRKLVAHTITAVLLTAVWAICFRPQIEKGRASLLSLFALVTIQAIGAWFARFMSLL